MNQDTINSIEEVISSMMDKILHRRVVLEPFNERTIEQNNPFGYRLVPMEIWKGSKFERSFVTSLGQKAFEQLAKIIAQGTGAESENQHTEEITINTWRKEKIDEILSFQRESQLRPNWESEVNEILALQNNRYENLNVRFDLYIRRLDGREEYYSLKTVKPNLDQTERAKRDMLYMKSCKEASNVYFALPFNPAGEGGNYRSVHSMPYSIFNMDIDESVLIGSAFWNMVGNDPNTYRELLDIFERVGRSYSNRIRRDYLGLEE
jgi:hypothetical protein